METENHNKKEKSYGNVVLIVIGILLIFAALSFHFVPERLTAFPKDNLTFSNTIILQSDIDNLIKRYNNASFYEKIAMKQEPFVRKLMEKGFIGEVDSKDQDKN